MDIFCRLPGCICNDWLSRSSRGPFVSVEYRNAEAPTQQRRRRMRRRTSVVHTLAGRVCQSNELTFLLSAVFRYRFSLMRPSCCLRPVHEVWFLHHTPSQSVSLSLSLSVSLSLCVPAESRSQCLTSLQGTKEPRSLCEVLYDSAGTRITRHTRPEDPYLHGRPLDHGASIQVQVQHFTRPVSVLLLRRLSLCHCFLPASEQVKVT